MGFKGLLEKQKPVGTQKYTLDTIFLGSDKHPVLELAYAGKGNAEYMSALYRLANAKAASTAAGGKISEESTRASQELDAQLFVHVIRGWDHVHEDAGAPPTPCTPEKVTELLLALADDHPHVLNGLTSYARNSVNFPGSDGTAEAGRALGKK